MSGTGQSDGGIYRLHCQSLVEIGFFFFCQFGSFAMVYKHDTMIIKSLKMETFSLEGNRDGQPLTSPSFTFRNVSQRQKQNEGETRQRGILSTVEPGALRAPATEGTSGKRGGRRHPGERAGGSPLWVTRGPRPVQVLPGSSHSFRSDLCH